MFLRFLIAKYMCCGNREGSASMSVSAYINRCWIKASPILSFDTNPALDK